MNKLRSKDFIDVQRKKKVEGVAELPRQLYRPELGHQDLPGKPNNTPTLTNLGLKSGKAFQDNGPTVPQSSPIFHREDPLKKLGVLETCEDDYQAPQLPSFSKTMPFGNQSVDYTLLIQMLQKEPFLPGNHCCIVEETFLPDVDVVNKKISHVVTDHLGNGSFGTVDLCISNSGKFVIKKVKKERLRANEVLIPVSLKHKNVCELYGLMQKEELSQHGNVKFTIELMIEYGGMALNRFLHSEGPLLPTKIWDLTYQGLDALKHLDCRGIIHHDVKPENLVIQRPTEDLLLLKLTDFGSARRSDEPIESVGWTVEYMAPECCKWVLRKVLSHDIHITGRADLFAFALVIMYMYKQYHVLQYEITRGKTTYQGFNRQQKQDMHQSLIIMLATEEDFVCKLIPNEVDPQMKELLEGMTKHRILDRFTADHALTVVKEREFFLVQFIEREAREKLQLPIKPQEPVSWNQTKKCCKGASATTSMAEDPLPSEIPEPRKRRKLQGMGKLIASKELVLQTPIQVKEIFTIAHQPTNTDVQKSEKTGPVVAQSIDNVDQPFPDCETVPVAAIQGNLPALDTIFPDIGKKSKSLLREQMMQIPRHTTALEQQGLAFGNTNRTTGIPTEESATPVEQHVMQAPEPTTQAPELAKPAPGNLPNFYLL